MGSLESLTGVSGWLLWDILRHAQGERSARFSSRIAIGQPSWLPTSTADQCELPSPLQIHQTAERTPCISHLFLEIGRC